MTTTLPLLQTVEGSPSGSSVNGFPVELMLGVRAGSDGRAAGLPASGVRSYAVIHPYFLKPGANELAGGGGRYRVAALEVQGGKDLGT
ncbi:hypothetical protein, partial [Pelomonas sp. KK5]|uniref:hypothetical protein n=1 Tax=Pelomonas sp. KK5 TaxID=1855730 RepID=UPI0018E95B6B